MYKIRSSVSFYINTKSTPQWRLSRYELLCAKHNITCSEQKLEEMKKVDSKRVIIGMFNILKDQEVTK